jgi:HK97 family phage major capsid protein
MDPRKARLNEIGAKARAIAAKAHSERRDFTPAESAEVKALFDEAKTLAAAIKSKAADDDAIRSILGLDGVTDQRTLGFNGKERVGVAGGRASLWAKSAAERIGEAFAQTKSITPNGAITVEALSAGIARREDRALTLLDLLTIVPLEGTDVFSYRRETARTNNARSTAVGKLKPTSPYGLEKISDRVRVIAHLSELIDNSLIADVDELEAFLGDVMAFGVLEALEDMLLTGDEDTPSPADDFDGILELSGTQGQAFTTNALTTARKAVTKLEVVNLSGPFAWVMSPARWEAFELEKDDEVYVLGDPGSGATGGRTLPVDTARRRLWGHPVAINNAIDDDTAVLGDWSPSSVRVREREAVTLTWTEAVADEEGTGFETNRRVWRAEGRYGVEWRRPWAFVVAELTAGS